MVSKSLVQVSVFLALTAVAATSLANNNLFLPGDAFFPTVLTKDDVETLQTVKSGERTFSYSSFGGYEGAFCGYAGYANARVPAVDDAFAHNLLTVYTRIREFTNRQLVERTTSGHTELIETNGIRVLFYPPDFEFPRHVLGLRYNEAWAEEAMKFGHPKKHLRLCCLIADPDAVGRSWRDAEVVSPLKVILPSVPLQPVPATEEPVVVRGPVKAIVIGSHTLKELFHASEDDNLTIYVVDSNRIDKFDHVDGTWQPSPDD